MAAILTFVGGLQIKQPPPWCSIFRLDLESMCDPGPQHLAAQVRGVLLDPSCSGSGTAANRLDALLPSRRRRAADADELDEVCTPSQ